MMNGTFKAPVREGTAKSDTRYRFLYPVAKKRE